MQLSFEDSMSKYEEFVNNFQGKVASITYNFTQMGTSQVFDTSSSPRKVAMTSFRLVGTESLNNIFSKLKPCTCSLNPIPTSFICVPLSFRQSP